MPTVQTKTANGSVRIDRRQLLAALRRCQAVVPNRSVKPILTGVFLESKNQGLRVVACDGEISLTQTVSAEGALPATVVPCVELVRRIRSCQDEQCQFSTRQRPSRLIINGGRVEHTLHALDAGEFPAVTAEAAGKSLKLACAVLHNALRIVVVGMARESTRYAINGVLLERDENGARLVATDGRRLVVTDLNGVQGEFHGRVILPAPFVELVQKLTEKAAGSVVLRVKANDETEVPGTIHAAGTDWLLSTFEPDKHFPHYRDIIPRGASMFRVERVALIEAVQEVALAVTEDWRTMGVDLTPRRIRLSAGSPEMGQSVAVLPARYMGGGDKEIHTAFNPQFVLDAVKSLDAEQVIIDIDQNGYGCDGNVFGKPAVIYAYGSEATKWVVMPVNAGLPATRANLGSNYREGLANAG